MSCLSRLLPNKRSIMAALATGGSFLPLLMRYVFGSYIPSFQQLMVNPVSFDCFSRGSVHSLLAHHQVKISMVACCACSCATSLASTDAMGNNRFGVGI